MVDFPGQPCAFAGTTMEGLPSPNEKETRGLGFFVIPGEQCETRDP
jgi:hypothetical protein